MKRCQSLLVGFVVLWFAGCGGGSGDGGHAPDEVMDRVAQADMPLLPVTAGDRWVYQVRLEIPEGVTSSTAAAVETKHEKTRIYLGKVKPAEGLPETDCFEVKVPGSPVEREFVEIHDDRILMRGSLIMRPEATQPMWLDPAVLFVAAGMKAGTAMPELRTPDGSLTRRMEVIAREDVAVPCGVFRAVRILMTGTDGELELRRTVWFAPGTGIVREEQVRYRRNRLIFREEQELTEVKRFGM